MKKILVIYSAHNETSAVRMNALIKYLPEFGWEPIILTDKSPKGLNKKIKTIIVPNNDNLEKEFYEWEINPKNYFMRVFRYLWKAFYIFPDFDKEWQEPAVKAANAFLEDEDVNIILSSFPRPTPLLIANNLSIENKIPWVADLRDLWTDYVYYDYNSFFPRKFVEKRLEKKTLSQANSITIVSKPLAEKLAKYRKKDVYVIPNGYDPENVNKGFPLTKKFSITYAGGLWGGRRDPRILFEAIQQLKSEEKIDVNELEINFFSPDKEWLQNVIKNYDLCGIVKIHGLIPRKEVIKKEWESQLLLLLLWDNPDEKGVYTGKLFEYLAAKRPILALGYVGGVVDDLLKQTNAGVSLDNVDEIKKEILRAYSEFKSYGSVQYNGLNGEVKKYSHKEMAKKFVDVFNQIGE